MKKYYLLVFFTLIFVVLFYAYYSNRKEDVYISFIDIKGYQYHFIDSTDISKIEKAIITQSGEMSYQRWEINVDTKSITKAEMLDVVKLIHNSQYWIISNYQPLGMSQKGLQKYRLHIIRWENDVPYILPISSVDIVME
jgi:hypothetical protein